MSRKTTTATDLERQVIADSELEELPEFKILASNGITEVGDCLVPDPDGNQCAYEAFHSGLHSWDSATRLVEDGKALAEEMFGTQSPLPEPPADPTQNGYGDGSFELAADVKAVRGKNTSDGPALEIVLDASIDSHVADIMGLIGRNFTRVIFRPYAVQQRLPDTEPAIPTIAPEGEEDE